MARLIDADLMAEDETAAFISTQVKITDMATRLVNEVVHKKIQMILADAPTGDIDHPTRSQFKRMAVQLGYEPVVHCKDCKHVMFSDCYGECGAARMGIVGPDDFCSYGGEPMSKSVMISIWSFWNEWSGGRHRIKHPPQSYCFVEALQT